MKSDQLHFTNRTTMTDKISSSGSDATLKVQKGHFQTLGGHVKCHCLNNTKVGTFKQLQSHLSLSTHTHNLVTSLMEKQTHAHTHNLITSLMEKQTHTHKLITSLMEKQTHTHTHTHTQSHQIFNGKTHTHTHTYKHTHTISSHL